MARTTLQTEHLVRDIRSGLHDDDLIEKYRVSRGELKNVLRKLLAAGRITQDDIARRPDYFFKRVRRLAIIAMFSDDDLMARLVLKGGNALDIAYSMEFRSSIDLDFSMDGEFDRDELAEVHRKIKRCLDETFRPEGYHVFDVTLEEKPLGVTESMADFWGGYQVEFKIMRATRYRETERDLASLRRSAEDVDTSAKKRFRIQISKFEY